MDFWNSCVVFLFTYSLFNTIGYVLEHGSKTMTTDLRQLVAGVVLSNPGMWPPLHDYSHCSPVYFSPDVFVCILQTFTRTPFSVRVRNNTVRTSWIPTHGAVQSSCRFSPITTRQRLLPLTSRAASLTCMGKEGGFPRACLPCIPVSITTPLPCPHSKAHQMRLITWYLVQMTTFRLPRHCNWPLHWKRRVSAFLFALFTFDPPYEIWLTMPSNRRVNSPTCKTSNYDALIVKLVLWVKVTPYFTPRKRYVPRKAVGSLQNFVFSSYNIYYLLLDINLFGFSYVVFNTFPFLFSMFFQHQGHINFSEY